jgi:hypothetical protein
LLYRPLPPGSTPPSATVQESVQVVQIQGGAQIVMTVASP